MTCIYALVSPPPSRFRLTGMAGEPLQVVTVDRVAAVVGEVRRASAPTSRTLRRYAAVVESIASRVDAILPARFATIAAGFDEVDVILRSRHAGLRRRLRAVRHRTQMTIRLVLESESGDTSPRSRSRTAGRTRLRLGNRATQGTQYLQTRMAIAAQAREVPGFAPVREAVRRFIKDERVERHGHIVTVNHLIPRTMVERYRTSVSRAAEAAGMRLVVTGPWAPYAFTDNG